ncbi:VRR-NUC domain-containing protein [Fusobacterium animalis]|uniref:VRR-NUC domain-containing protein n=1 Tax=Fusobacterium animalis TaxID=76859 RepID=UPI0030CB44FE
MLEKQVENQIKKWLEENNHWYFKVHGGPFQKVGVPDIVACIKGKFVAIEVKRPNGGVVSKLQQVQMEQIKACGGVVGVARSLDEFIQILKDSELL